MAKSVYKEKILEKLRVLHEEEALLYDILNEVKRSSDSEDKEKE